MEDAFVVSNFPRMRARVRVKVLACIRISVVHFGIAEIKPSRFRMQGDLIDVTVPLYGPGWIEENFALNELPLLLESICKMY